MKKNKKINISGTLLDKNQLVKHIEKRASEHNIKSYSNSDTYPIPNLIKDYKFILETYNLLTKHIKLGIKIHSAGEWLLDNFYIIEETVKNIKNELTEKRYKNYPIISNGMYKGFARIYLLAAEIVAYTDNKIDEDILEICLSAYERKKILSMEEIWSLPIFLNIALIENIRNVCEKIIISKSQKYKVEEIVERIIEKRELIKQQYKKNKESTKIYKNSSYPFIEYMSYKLKQYRKNGIPYLNSLEEQVNKKGITI